MDERMDPRNGTRVVIDKPLATLLLVVMLMTLGAGTGRAVVVAPHALFIDHRTRSGVLYLHNPGDVPEEVVVDLEYGYPVSDGEGGVRIELIPDPPASAPSAAGWVRALPARTVVAPGARQAIRFLAQPPAGLADGEYWSRVIVTARGARPPVAAAENEAVQVGLTLEMRTITSLTYRKGKVTTGVHLDGFTASLSGDTVTTDIRLSRTGKGAFLGSLELMLTDPAGVAVGTWKHAVAVYEDLYRRLEFPVGTLAPGRYVLALRISTARDDIPEVHVLETPPIETTVALDVP